MSPSTTSTSVTPMAPGDQRKRSRTRRRASTRTAYVYLSPALVLMLLVFGFPIVVAILLSLGEYNPFARTFEFTGLANYEDVLTSPAFWHSVGITVVWTVASVILEYVIALSVAILLNRLGRGSRVFRVIFGLPWAVPPVFAALIWATIYDPTGGPLNQALGGFGFPGDTAWLGDSRYALASLIVVTLWKFTPFMILTLLAGMQGIDDQVYEAASLDGSRGWSTFRFITLPLLMPVTIVVLTLATLWRAKHFDIVWTLTNGGPGTATDVLAVRAFRETVINLDAGAGASIAVLLAIGLMGFILVMSRRLLRGEN